MTMATLSAGPPEAAAESDEFETIALAWAIRNRLRRLGCASTSPHGASSGVPDPTRGATHFHRHDETPDWAASRRAVALIGAYLFYI